MAAAAPAIEQVVAALVTRLEAVAPSLRKGIPFKRSGESVLEDELPLRAAMRHFNVDPLEGQDDSQGGNGVQNLGVADRTARFRISLVYPRVKSEKLLEDVLASDAELALRALARDAAWTGTPIRRVVTRWKAERRGDRLLLRLELAVQYRDQE